MSEDTRGRGLVRVHSANSIHDRKHIEVAEGPPRSISMQHGQAHQRKSEDLRHTAVRNGLRSSKLSMALSRAQSVASATHNHQFQNKNIAMVQHERKPRPNWDSTWSNFTLTQAEKEPVQKDGRVLKSSISPLTRPGQATRATPTSLAPISSPPMASLNVPSTDNKFSDLGEVTPKKPLSARSRFSVETGRSKTLAKRSSIRSEPLLKYASEPDSSDDYDEDDDDGQDEHLSLLDPEFFDTDGTSSLSALAQEILVFQKSLVGSAPHVQPTRTQQRVLDLRDLLREETQSPTQPTLGNQNFMVRIQHDKILSEWTQIRLRFSSHMHSKNMTRCSAGILGFVERYKARGWPEKTSSHTVTKETKDEYLASMWQSGFLVKKDVLEELRDIYKEQRDIYKEQRDIYKESAAFDMSSLAQTAMSRQSPVAAE